MPNNAIFLPTVFICKKNFFKYLVHKVFVSVFISKQCLISTFVLTVHVPVGIDHEVAVGQIDLRALGHVLPVEELRHVSLLCARQKQLKRYQCTQTNTHTTPGSRRCQNITDKKGKFRYRNIHWYIIEKLVWIRIQGFDYHICKTLKIKKKYIYA